MATLLTITYFDAFAQQNQNTQKPNPEIEVLKGRISELESKLQTIENVEKMELMAKLAEANAKLANAEIDKYKRELKDANDEWLKSWSTWFLTISGIFIAILIGISAVFWFWLRSRADQLIADSVEKSLNGFKEAVGQVDTLENQLKKSVEQISILKNQIRILEKEHTASVLEGFVHLPDTRGQLYSEIVKALPDGGLLDLIVDKTRGIEFRYKAAEVLAVRENPKVVSPVLELLNSIVDLQVNGHFTVSEWYSGNLVDFLGQFHMQEVYEGLMKFLNRLLMEGPRYKGLLLKQTVFSLARVSVGLHNGGSVSILKKTVTDLKVLHYQDEDIRILAEYFDRFNEPEGIQDILTNGLTDEMPDVETQCLELLEKHDPEFVEQWKAQKAEVNTENKESS